ncbi:ABC transporter substrate-binding protein [Bifidobacterium callitrichos]|uniref:ABC transporter substrate-binding protein n=2 Tax=Bifidobacterium callitrichos TaxID=762209 RepID=A0A5M9Z9K0_9BIFI|nr:ABC transporter substrate-binding protein [Bifidobacterium callitrichos]KAA8815172.1 ABC transporter substrate-binding protein [Bifidobacterium callitrichos]KFI54642.1 peptide ABC transporter substrate-binding protein [Bifidobacterium callitrichos DSM 23973]
MRTKKNKGLRSALAAGLAAVLALSLAACSQTGGTTASSDADANASGSNASAQTTFTYARAASVTSLNLWTEITANNAFAIDKVFEPLVSFDKDGKIIDWLAESHKISDDGLTYTFTLRDGLKFSDGSDVTAADAVFSIKQHQAEKDAALPLTADIASVDAPDDHTVEIKLNSPYTPLLAELANFSNGIVPKDFGGKSEDDFFKNPVGTGPFVVSDWDKSGDLTFTKNKHYWQEGKPGIDKLVYKVVEDGTQAVNQLKTGEVDGIESPALENLDELENGADTKVETAGSWVTHTFFFNTKDEHFADVHVRRALAYALSREDVTKAVSFGHATAAKTVLPKAIEYSTQDSIKPVDNDLDKAKAELAESKFPQGFSAKILLASGNNAYSQAVQLLQSAAAKIGVKLDIDSVDIATFRSRFKAYDYQIMINSAQADYPDADSIIDFQADPDGFSKSYWTSYSNDEVTKELKQAQVTPDGSERAGLYKKIQQTLADEVPYIPLYSPDIVKAVRKNVSGLEVLPNDSVRFQDVKIG